MLAKALTRAGDFKGAYAKLCIGNKIDEDEDSAALQKTLKAKVDKLKKISDQRAKKANAVFDALGLPELWASLELDVHEKHGEASLHTVGHKNVLENLHPCMKQRDTFGLVLVQHGNWNPI